MIKKAIYPDSLDMGVSPVALIGYYSRGLDKCAMDKRASVFSAEDLKFPQKPNHRYLHIITTGGVEKYGCNLNGDGWCYDHMTITFKDPKDKHASTYSSDGGLKKYHNKEYMSKEAAVYKEHQTKRQNVEPSGYIVKAATNDNMCRGELIIGVDENKWGRELQKKANGGNIFFSIGCNVSKDICSHCGNQASERTDYCDHVKNAMLKLTKDGDKIFVYNDDPHFYDISGVNSPADRIAFALREVSTDKTASINKSASVYTSIPDVFGIPVSKKIAVALKLSNMDKEIPAEVTDNLECGCCDDDAEVEAVERLKQYRADEVLDILNRKGIMLGPKAFYRLLASDTDNPDEITNVTDDLKIDPQTVIHDLSGEDDPFCSGLGDSIYDREQTPDIGLMNLVDSGFSGMKSDPEAIKDRIIKITIVKKASRNPERIEKEASGYVSEDYAKYAVSFVTVNPGRELFALTKIRAYSK